MYRYIKMNKQNFGYEYGIPLPYGIRCLLGDRKISESEIKQHIETALKERNIKYDHVVVFSPYSFTVYGLDEKNYSKLKNVWHKLDIEKYYYESDTELEELHKRTSNSYTRIH